MGLDTVELVLAVEDWFEITIPDEVAETLFTVGDLHRLVVSELKRTNRFGGDDALLFDQLRTLIVRHLGVKPEEVVPAARFVQDLHAD